MLRVGEFKSKSKGKRHGGDREEGTQDRDGKWGKREKRKTSKGWQRRKVIGERSREVKYR